MYEKSYINFITHNPHHMKTVFDIQQRAYKVEAEIIGYLNLPPLKESIDDLMSTDYMYRGCRLYMETEGFKDAGVIAYEEMNHQIFIHKVVVDPTYFHKGIASFLLCNLFQEKSNCKTFCVSTAKKNIPACTLYEKFGFIIENEIEKSGILLVKYVKKSV